MTVVFPHTSELATLLAEVDKGREVIISQDGRELARLTGIDDALRPAPRAKGPRKPGSMKGLISLGPEFFDPLPEEELKAWYGE